MQTTGPNNWQSGFAAAVLDPERAVPEGLSARDGSAIASRFAVYRNNVAAGLAAGLCDTFQVCRELVGDEFFRAMAHAYIRAHPPVSPVLAEYGGTFADFIATFPPAADFAYLADVARLEHARVVAYHAGDARSVPMERWQQVDAATLADCRVEAHPSVRLLSSAYAAVSIWAAHQEGAELAGIDPGAAEDALILRPALEVLVMALPPGGIHFFTALTQGENLAGAAARAGARTPSFDLAANLAILMQSGFAVELTGQDNPGENR